jgi:hypothetical protein
VCHQVTTYKVITLRKGASYQRLQREASIPEGTVSSPEGSAGTGGTMNGSPGMLLMETWCALCAPLRYIPFQRPSRESPGDSKIMSLASLACMSA